MKRGAAGKPVTRNWPERLRIVCSLRTSVARDSVSNKSAIDCLIFATGLRRGLALGFLGFGVRRGGCGRLAFARFFFSRFLVLFAAIIRDVKAAALEDQAGARANRFFHASLAPLFHAATLFRANCEGL